MEHVRNTRQHKKFPNRLCRRKYVGDRQKKVDEFVESMEKYDDEHPCPTDLSTMGAIQEYMRNLETHAALKVKQLYRRAGQEERQSSHKDGWSPVFIGY